MASTTLTKALVIHAIAAPVIFAAITFVYFRRFAYFSPLRTASVFVATVMLLDVCVVAPVIERSFAMFRSPLGTWIPFLLIFLASWVSGKISASAVGRSR